MDTKVDSILEETETWTGVKVSRDEATLCSARTLSHMTQTLNLDLKSSRSLLKSYSSMPTRATSNMTGYLDLDNLNKVIKNIASNPNYRTLVSVTDTGQITLTPCQVCGGPILGHDLKLGETC